MCAGLDPGGKGGGNSTGTGFPAKGITAALPEEKGRHVRGFMLSSKVRHEQEGSSCAHQAGSQNHRMVGLGRDLCG